MEGLTIEEVLSSVSRNTRKSKKYLNHGGKSPKSLNAKKTEETMDLSSKLSDISSSSSEPQQDGEVKDMDYRQFEKDLKWRHAEACKAMSAGNYQQALDDFEGILQDLLNRYGDRHERVGSALHNVAIANLRAGKLEDAMDAIEEAIKIRSRSLGKSHMKVADSLVELGIILLSLEDHDDALKVFERALKIRRDEHAATDVHDELEDCNLRIAKVLNNIGCVHFETGELELARKSFNEAIQLQQGVFNNWITYLCGVDTTSPGLLTMSSTMCNLAYIELEEGSYDKATKIFMEALDIQKKVLGETNKLVLSTLDNLAFCSAAKGNREEALKAYYEIWDLIEHTGSPKERIDIMRKLIFIHCRMEQWQKAYELLEKLDDLHNEHDQDSESHEETRQLLGEVNYQNLKLPTLSESTTKAFGCAACLGTIEEDLHLDRWVIQKPANTSKMSGHRVTQA